MFFTYRRFKKSIYISVLSAFLLLLSGCGDTDGGSTDIPWIRLTETEQPTTEEPDTGTEQPTTGEPDTGTPEPGGKDPGTEVELPEYEIVLLSGFSNAAWSYAQHGYFVLGNGNVYVYNFDMSSYPDMNGVSFYDKLTLIRNSVRPSGTMDTELLKTLYNYGMKIDPETKMDVKNEACDYGENSIVFRDPEKDRWITCYEQGDNTGYRNDPNARKLADLWMEKEETAVKITEKVPDHLFTPGDAPIESIHSGRIELDDSQKRFYVADSLEKLRKFAKEKGFDVEGFIEGLRDYQKEDSLYFMQINNVVNTGVDFNTAGFLFGDGSYRFIESPNNRYEEDGEVSPDRLDGYVYIAAIYKYDLDIDTPEGMKAINGQKWIYLH